MEINWLIPPAVMSTRDLEFYVPHHHGCAILDSPAYQCDCNGLAAERVHPQAS